MKNFIHLNDDEKILVLNWRNSERVKVNMLTKNTISKKDHFKFIENLSQTTNKQYYLIDDIGVIYFTNIDDNSAEIALYSNPDKYNVGDKLMQYILSFKFTHLYLKVFKNNKRAINLYKKYNFKEIIKKELDTKEMIYMELNNENSNFNL
ncbi:MAG: UDP-4-amino-4,6-dideoxy-N-acetyl-beta-L-altrosamine N-acetyltransferase [Campylobacterota bacterium]|nr:UDP-4-amino-4,6-dideoxy-N-acetyl-beta-L-altrosamine N-acetyltransferase [Campylobacterota bacterium]